MQFRRLIILTLSWTVSFSALVAEPVRPNLTLADALALTLKQNPELSVYDWDIRVTEARIIQARLRPNPELSLTAENFTGSGSFKNGDAMEQTLQLSQLVELGGKRAVRVAEAQAGRRVAEWGYQVRRVEVLKAATQAFVDVLAAQQQVQLAEDSAALAERVVPITKRRVEIGKASAVEVTRSNISVASAKIELEQAKRTLATARGNLAAQWGSKRAEFDSVSGELGRLKKLPSLPVLSEKIAHNPEIVRWTAERERRIAILAGAKAQGRPDITFIAGPRMIGKGSDVTAIAGISLPLPLWNRNQGNIAEARANIAKIDDEKKTVEVRTLAELNAAYQTLSRAANEVETLNRDVLPGAKEAEEMITEGYEAGRFSQLEILDARRTLTAARSQNLRALADYHKAVADIEALTATPVELHSFGGQRQQRAGK